MAKSKTPPDPARLVKEIEGGVDEYRAAATELTKRIKAFEAWVGTLSGVTETQWGEPDDPEDPSVYWEISLRRNGKAWVLSHSMVDYQNQESRYLGLIRDADVKTKMRVIRILPDLLEAIREAQQEFVKDAQATAADFDAFAAQIGLKEGA